MLKYKHPDTGEEKTREEMLAITMVARACHRVGNQFIVEMEEIQSQRFVARRGGALFDLKMGREVYANVEPVPVAPSRKRRLTPRVVSKGGAALAAAIEKQVPPGTHAWG